MITATELLEFLTKAQRVSGVGATFRQEDGNGWTEFAGKPDAFLKFAHTLLECKETQKETN